MEELVVRNNNEASLVKYSNEELMKKFLSYCDIKPTSQKIYRNALQYFMNYVQGKQLQEITREKIVEYKEELRKQELQVNTINIKIKVVKRFFQFLEFSGLYKDITRGIKLETVAQGHKKEFITMNQVKILLNTVSSDRDKMIILLAFTTGLRVSEMARLQVKDICFHHGVPSLMILGKARSEKEPLVISNSLYCDLMNYCKGKSEEEPIFCNNRHHTPKALTGDHISRILKGALKGIGIDSPKYTAHSFRHGSITNALLNGASLTEVQAMARHRSLQTTMCYNHELEVVQNKAVDLNYKALFG